MTEKHRDPLYLKNARIVRAQVRRAWKYGTEIACWRCGLILEPGMPWDVGHRNPDAGHDLSNLAPECRRCNRRDGGRRGAAITNARRAAPRAVPRPAPTAGLAPW